MESIKDILQSCSSITLEEMDSVKFMNRIDRKYVFHSSLISEIVKSAAASYRVLQIDEKRSFTYNTTYFDTETCDMYYQHTQGKLNRQKLRMRVYEITGTSFLEIKMNTNKGRTIKERIKTWDKEGVVVETDDFLKERLPFDVTSLKPVLYTSFNRITLVSTVFKERITIDFNLAFESIDGKKVSLPHIGIAETKNDSHSNNTPIVNILKKNHICSMSFSKYCIGSALLNENFKKNIFKPQLLLIEKLKKNNELNNNLILS